jgi:hypothetical protein
MPCVFYAVYCAECNSQRECALTAQEWQQVAMERVGAVGGAPAGSRAQASDDELGATRGHAPLHGVDPTILWYC